MNLARLRLGAKRIDLVMEEYCLMLKEAHES